MSASKKFRSMGGHHSHKIITDEWLTPPNIIKALGVFDLDPCVPDIMPWTTAARMINKTTCGLKEIWTGRVWLNPPYTSQIGQWMKKMAEHDDGIALVFARVETKWFFDYVWNHASAILFLKGRLTFSSADGIAAKHNSGAPSALIAYGENNALVLSQSGIAGKLVYLKSKAA